MRRGPVVMVALIAVLSIVAPSAARADTPLDHGSFVDNGCTASYSMTPDPAAAGQTITLTLSVSCSGFTQAAIELSPAPFTAGSDLPLQPSGCDHWSGTTPASLTCAYPNAAPHTVYQALFSFLADSSAPPPPPEVFGQSTDQYCTWYDLGYGRSIGSCGAALYDAIP